ncbi:hypothetical protein FOL47_010582 [Perkinsus chesapeaki]|uniref:Pseudouridine synthase RsuA/RluA-like domain-containing protein n=1 Tax=Perkinsus chesapeaki TaxID=330153 RepID=A0A7J6MQC6_PERCH|nr:hypothetical protein FOL47_010582 [Perkinsus chesapeaki]
MVMHYIEGLYQGMSVKVDEVKERLASNCSFCRGDILSFLRPSTDKAKDWYKDTAGGLRHSPVTFTEEEANVVNNNGGDCYTCRMVGFITFAATSAYCLAESKRNAGAGTCRSSEEISEIIKNKTDRFEDTHWIIALRRFAHFNSEVKTPDTRLALKVCLSLPIRSLDFRAVSDIIWALGTLGVSRTTAQPFIDQAVRLVRLSTSQPPLQRLAALLVGVARGKFERGCLMSALEGKMRIDRDWSGRDVSLCLWALGRFSYEGPLVDLFAEWVSKVDACNMSEQDWSLILFNLGRLGRFDLSLVPLASTRMNDSRNVATLLWSAGQAQGGAKILQRVLKDHYEALSDRLLPADIPQVMWALARVDGSMRLGSLAVRLAQKLRDENWVPMNRLEVNNVAYGLHWSRVMTMDWYEWLHGLLKRHLVKLPTRDVGPGVVRVIPESIVDGAKEPVMVYTSLGGVSIVYKPNAWTTEMTQEFLGESLVLAHRIDFGTSGPLMGTVTEGEEAVLALQQQAGLVGKKYRCLVEGILMEKVGEINARIENLETWCVVSSEGKPAVTQYRVIEEFPGVGVSLVQCELLSGRKHQIRVHMASLGHPLVGDPWYNSETKLKLEVGRIFLHCRRLEWMDLYSTKERYGVEVPLPRDLRDIYEQVTKAEIESLQ